MSALLLAGGLALAGCAQFLKKDPIVTLPPDRVVVFGHLNDWDEARLSLLRMRMIPVRHAVAMAGDPDANLPDGTTYLLTAPYPFHYEILPKEDHVVYEFEAGGRDTIRCPGLALHVPDNASAIYTGHMVFHRERRGFGERDLITLSVLDKYDEALRDFRKAQPGFQGRIAKALYAPPTSASGKHITCSWHREPSNFLEILFAPMFARP